MSNLADMPFPGLMDAGSVTCPGCGAPMTRGRHDVCSCPYCRSTLPVNAAASLTATEGLFITPDARRLMAELAMARLADALSDVQFQRRDIQERIRNIPSKTEQAPLFGHSFPMTYFGKPNYRVGMKDELSSLLKVGAIATVLGLLLGFGVLFFSFWPAIGYPFCGGVMNEFRMPRI